MREGKYEGVFFIILFSKIEILDTKKTDEACYNCIGRGHAKWEELQSILE